MNAILATTCGKACIIQTNLEKFCARIFLKKDPTYSTNRKFARIIKIIYALLPTVKMN
jgi:hypothetical protein